jgi:hypothetical protein
MNRINALFMPLTLLLLSFMSMAQDVWVEGYSRSDGTYVDGHYRSAPNGTKADNWSTLGNVNPHTGEIGTRTYDAYQNRRQDGQKDTGNDYYGSESQIPNSHTMNSEQRTSQSNDSLGATLFYYFLIFAFPWAIFSHIIGFVLHHSGITNEQGEGKFLSGASMSLGIIATIILVVYFNLL